MKTIHFCDDIINTLRGIASDYGSTIKHVADEIFLGAALRHDYVWDNLDPPPVDVPRTKAVPVSDEVAEIIRLLADRMGLTMQDAAHAVLVHEIQNSDLSQCDFRPRRGLVPRMAAEIARLSDTDTVTLAADMLGEIASTSTHSDTHAARLWRLVECLRDSPDGGCITDSALALRDAACCLTRIEDRRRLVDIAGRLLAVPGRPSQVPADTNVRDG